MSVSGVPRTNIVIGGASGIGWATSQRLARSLHGLVMKAFG
jgi:NAD(P)-dependent dehydrogenase (short-subunit alcohol dehydrogenase family)